MIKSIRAKIKKIKKEGFLKFVLRNKAFLIVLVIFLFELFLRFYQMDVKSPFGYDQVDNAWAAKNIIVNHQFPLVGMVAKGNSNIYIGPAYYYLIAVFYWIFNLNPIASAVIAGVTSIFTFWVIFYVAKKMFSTQVAIFAVFLNTFSIPGIMFDRVQWPVDFIPSIALLIFYLLYKIMNGDVKKIIILALVVGFSFSIHFTSVFYPVIILFSLPFFPRTKETLKYILLSIPLFLIWLVPNVIYQLQQSTSGSNFTSYFKNYYHGFHLTRVFQLAGDGLIQFNAYSFFDLLTPLKFIIIPVFYLVFLYKSLSRKNLVFCYLVALWFIIPWFIFATYSGEISDYYFSTSRFVALLIVSYFFARIWNINNIIAKAIVIIVLLFIGFVNVSKYLPYSENSLLQREAEVSGKISGGERVEFQVGVPQSYLYWYLMRQKGKDVYVSKDK